MIYQRLTRPLSSMTKVYVISVVVQNINIRILIWGERKQLLDQLIEKFRGKSDYDCIVPFSGGKDSTINYII